MKKATTIIIAAIAIATAAFTQADEVDDILAAAAAMPDDPNPSEQTLATRAAADECIAKFGKNSAKHLPEVKKISSRVGADVIAYWGEISMRDSLNERRDCFYLDVLSELDRRGNLEEGVWDREYEKDLEKWGDE